MTNAGISIFILIKEISVSGARGLVGGVIAGMTVGVAAGAVGTVLINILDPHTDAMTALIGGAFWGGIYGLMYGTMSGTLGGICSGVLQNRIAGAFVGLVIGSILCLMPAPGPAHIEVLNQPRFTETDTLNSGRIARFAFRNPRNSNDFRYALALNSTMHDRMLKAHCLSCHDLRI